MSALSAGAMISVEEYLATSYRPDCDYVDGRIEERNSGGFTHASLQAALAVYFITTYRAEGISVATELRIEMKPGRFQVPIFA
jgi:hypothetical protein